MYRPEIDGLRAAAVVPVVLFHGKLLDGGFVGVDVFFVISGYLITALLLNDLEQSQFSFAKFYGRRARRILPALLFVLACCMPFAWLLMSAPQISQFNQGLLATLLFVSNIHLWQQPTGYFSQVSEENPLLHTWSLSIEEQYYLAAPFLLLIAWKAGRKPAVTIALATIFAASLWFSDTIATQNKEANFYLIQSRAWELALGALAAMMPRIKAPALSREFLTIAGIAAIAYSIATFDQSTPFPSRWALYPTLGTVAVILFSHQTRVGSILALTAPIGLISYSTYLWHQPLFAFAHLYTLERLSVPVVLALALSSFALGFISYKLIEQPLRRHASSATFTAIAGGLAAACFAFAMLGPFKPPLPASVYASLQLHKNFYACVDFKNGHNTEGQWYCELSQSSSKPSFFVFGDSHAVAMEPAFRKAAIESGRQGLFTAFSGCAPLLGIHSYRGDQDIRNCHDMNRRVLEYAKSHAFKDVFLVARWSYYTDGGYDGKGFSQLSVDPAPAKEPTKEDSRAAFLKGVRITVEEYKTAGIKLHIVLQSPQQKYEAPKVYRNAALNASSSSYLEAHAINALENARLQQFARAAIKDAAPDGVIDPLPIFCRDRCVFGTSAQSYYTDDDHLSETGSLNLVSRLVEALRPQLP